MKGKETKCLYKNIAAKPSTPAPTTGAAVLTAKPLDDDEDFEPLVFALPVPVWC